MPADCIRLPVVCLWVATNALWLLEGLCAI